MGCHPSKQSPSSSVTTMSESSPARNIDTQTTTMLPHDTTSKQVVVVKSPSTTHSSQIQPLTPPTPNQEESHDQVVSETSIASDLNESESPISVVDISSTRTISERQPLETNSPEEPTPDAPPPLPQAQEMVPIVQAVLDDFGVTYSEVPLEKINNPLIRIIQFDLAGKYTTCSYLLSMDMEDRVFSVYYTLTNLKIPAARRSEISRYLASINYQIMLGHWDLDYRDGEVRYKHAVTLPGASLSLEMVQQMVGLALKTMDKYLPGLWAVEFAGHTAEQGMRIVQETMSSTTAGTATPAVAYSQ